MAKVLVADSIAQEGIALLKKHHDVEVRTGLKEDELCEAVKDVSALVVRSATTVTATTRTSCLHLPGAVTRSRRRAPSKRRRCSRDRAIPRSPGSSTR